jgi:hypothetical protein
MMPISSGVALWAKLKGEGECPAYQIAMAIYWESEIVVEEGHKERTMFAQGMGACGGGVPERVRR